MKLNAPSNSVPGHPTGPAMTCASKNRDINLRRFQVRKYRVVDSDSMKLGIPRSLQRGP
jgi:hypothetical protein